MRTFNNFDCQYLIFYLFQPPLPGSSAITAGMKMAFIVLKGDGVSVYYICSLNSPTLEATEADKYLCQEDILKVPGAKLIFASWVNSINNCHFCKSECKKPAQTKESTLQK